MSTALVRDEILTAQAVADELGVVEKTVRRWIAAGKLPGEKVDRVFAVRRTDLVAFQENNNRSRASRKNGELERTAKTLDAELIALRAKNELLEVELARLRREYRDAIERAAIAEHNQKQERELTAA